MWTQQEKVQQQAQILAFKVVTVVLWFTFSWVWLIICDSVSQYLSVRAPFKPSLHLTNVCRNKTEKRLNWFSFRFHDHLFKCQHSCVPPCWQMSVLAEIWWRMSCSSFILDSKIKKFQGFCNYEEKEHNWESLLCLISFVRDETCWRQSGTHTEYNPCVFLV